MITYLNLRDSNGVETVDELNSNDFNSSKEFNEELKRLIKEYHMAGMGVYKSQRCTSEWKLKNNN